MKKGKQILFYSSLLVIGLYFLFAGISNAKSFLAPFITAVILALVVLPVSRKMEGSLLKRGYSSFLSTFLLFLVSVGFTFLISLQFRSFLNDWEQIEQTMKPEIEDFKTFVFEHTALEEETLSTDELLPFLEPGNRRSHAMNLLSSTVIFLGTYVLTFIYIFFLLNYRRHFKKSIIKFFPDGRKPDVRLVIEKSGQVVQDYLFGRVILMAILAVLYSIGLGISGVENFILISVISALLTIIPWIGNVIALALAMAFGYLTSGEISILIGIILTFTISQFFESYILQPYIVGDKVGLHPLVVILAVILGGTVWGLIGLVLAIPVMAIITIVFRNVKPLEPLGFLFSKEENAN